MRIAERRLLAAFGVGGLAAALLPAGAAMLGLFALLTGAPLALRLARRWDLTELFGVSVALSLVAFAVLTPAAYAAGAERWLRFAPLAVAAAMLVTARRRRSHFVIVRLLPMLFTAVVAGAAIAVALRNGPASSAEDAPFGAAPAYEARNWYGRDAFYLFALVESTRAHGGPPVENPFLSGVANMYPAALHGALAGMLAGDPRPAAVALARPFPLFLAAVAGLLAAWAGRFARRRRAIVPLVAALGAFLLRPDFFVYPQSQPLALLVLLLLLWCLGPRPARAPRRLVALAAVLGPALVLAHSVTAGVAIAVLGGAAAALGLRRRFARAGWLGLAAVAGLIAFVAWHRAPAPGPSGGSLDAEALALLGRYGMTWILPLAGVGLVLARSARGTEAVRAGGCAVLALGAAYAIHGVGRGDPIERWFVIFNAQRFALIALVVMLPLFAASSPRIAALAAALVVAGAVTMPGEVARDTLLLVREEPLVVSAERLMAMEFVRRTTPPDARFLTTARDHVLPAFTGRAQFTNDRWNLWGMNTIKAADFSLRLAARDRIFRTDVTVPDAAGAGAGPATTPEQRAGLLDYFGITHLALDGAWPDDVSAVGWIERNFPPGAARLVFRNREVIVVELGPPRRAE